MARRWLSRGGYVSAGFAVAFHRIGGGDRISLDEVVDLRHPPPWYTDQSVQQRRDLLDVQTWSASPAAIAGVRGYGLARLLWGRAKFMYMK